MPDTWFIVGCILIPLSFGLVPGLLPRHVPMTGRWGLWLVLLAVFIWFVHSTRAAPSSLQGLALVLLCLSSMLSLSVLIAETRRAATMPRV